MHSSRACCPPRVDPESAFRRLRIALSHWSHPIMFTRLLTAAWVFTAVAPASADDWPQWRGPNRDGVSKETGLLKEWPKDGPKLLWSAKDLGTGYSTPSVAGGKVFLISSRDKEEFCQAFDAKTGAKLWEVKI